MHLVVQGAVAHLFHIKCALNQVVMDRVWIYPDFRSELADGKALSLQAGSRPTHRAEIVRHEPTHMGFCDASVLGVGGVHNLV